jgi:hypothetical protein
MTRSNRLPLMKCFALAIAVAGSTSIFAAEDGVLAQDLLKVTASEKVLAALWTRRPDSYTLQLVLDRSRYEVTHDPVASPRVESALPPAAQGNENTATANFFIGTTIANLRGLDPCFGDRTLTLVDGRRKAPLVQVWLLRADGTQIQPIGQSPEPNTYSGCQRGRTIADEVLYRFSSVDSAQAIAAAIRIDDEYYIEKLRLLESKPAAQ